MYEVIEKSVAGVHVYYFSEYCENLQQVKSYLSCCGLDVRGKKSFESLKKVCQDHEYYNKKYGFWSYTNYEIQRI